VQAPLAAAAAAPVHGVGHGAEQRLRHRREEADERDVVGRVAHAGAVRARLVVAQVDPPAVQAEEREPEQRQAGGSFRTSTRTEIGRARMTYL